MKDHSKLSRSQAFEASEDEGTNPSANDTIGDIIAERLSRRDLVGGMLAATAIGMLVSPGAVLAAGEAKLKAGGNTTPSFDFKELTAAWIALQPGDIEE